MKIALLAADENLWPLVTAARDAGWGTLIAAFNSPEYVASLQQWGVPHSSDWESLLHETQADCIWIGTGGESQNRARQLRGLFQAGVPLLISHPIAEMLLAFELQMIQDDSRVAVLPFFPGCDHPAFERLAEWQADAEGSPVGRLEQFEWERAMHDRGQPAVFEQFCRDAYLQRKLVSSIDRLSAMLPSTAGETARDAGADWSQLSVQMQMSGGALARWFVKSAQSSNSRLRIVGDRGTAVLELAGDPSQWRLQIESPEPRPVELPPWTIDHLAPQQIEAAVRGERTSDYELACRAIELADTIEVSTRRGRTIDLHQEEVTEVSTFKSMMAAGGCLAILVTLGVTFLAAALGPLSPAYDATPGRPHAGDASLPWLWSLLLIGLVGFLLLQSLRLVFRPDDGASKDGNRR